MFKKIFQILKEVFYKLGLIKGAKSVFKNKYIPSYDEFYNQITDWKDVYKGTPPWRDIKKSTINSPNNKRQMATLNVAKVLCNEMASLTFSEKCTISVSDEILQKYVDNVLSQNGFYKEYPQWLELLYAIGGGVLKTYLDNGNVKIDYVDANNFIPTAWDNQKISEGIFITRSQKNGYFYNLFECRTLSHQLDADDNINKPCCVINNILYESKTKDEIGVYVPLNRLYPNLSEQTIIYNASSLFSYARPCTSNNFDTNSPLGISIFANCLDTLKALDIAFDSFSREFVLGKKRIIVPSSAIKAVPNENGTMCRYFDANDEVYQALKFDDTNDLKIQDNTISLRIEEHVNAINALLNILCMQTGLSSGTLSFDGSQGVKTATEVISANSKTYRTKQAHQNVIGETIIQTVKDIITLGISQNLVPNITDYEVTINFDDSIIIDENANADRIIKLVGAQLMSKVKALQNLYGYDEKMAITEYQRIIDEDRQISGADIDLFGGE